MGLNEYLYGLEVWHRTELMREVDEASLAKRPMAVRRRSTSRTPAAGALGFLVAALVVVAAPLLLWASGPAHAATTFTVNTTADFPDANLDDTVNVCDIAINKPGAQCTLRAAIEEANHTEGADAINFNIREDVDPGVKTIQPTSELPTITDQVTIDGYTQPGASPNTLAKGTNAKLLIELDGSFAGPTADGLEVRASNTVIRGLVVNHFGVDGIQIAGTSSTGVRVEGNFVGTDPSGTSDAGNNRDGVVLAEGASNNAVGGSTPDKRNLISGNDFNGVGVAFSSNNKVLGNLIGTKKDGKSALGNSFSGVLLVSGTDHNVVGGSTATSANVISFNGDDGVVITGSDTISNDVLQNSIFSNVGEGIDLILNRVEGDGPTKNDFGDADAGPNGLQNKPVVRSAVTSDGKTTIRGKLLSEPKQSYVVMFFSNPSGNEGKAFIGQKKVTTSSDGKATFIFSPAQKVGLGKKVTATATGSEGTSEFSAPRTVTAS